MVVVQRFRDLPGAEVASATLDAAAVPHFLADTATIGLVWTYSTALGWIRLFVGENDRETAQLLLTPDEAIEWPEMDPDAAPDERCPACDSMDLAVESGARKTIALALLLLSVPIWFWRSRLVCRTCGYSRKIPLRFRPELVLVWLISAVVAIVLTAAITFSAMYIARGRT
jgi:hypothetical protein